MGWCSKCKLYFYQPNANKVFRRCPQCKKMIIQVGWWKHHGANKHQAPRVTEKTNTH